MSIKELKSFIHLTLKQEKEKLLERMEIEGIHSPGFCNKCNQNLCKCPERDKGGNWMKLPSNAVEIIKRLKKLKEEIKE